MRFDLSLTLFMARIGRTDNPQYTFAPYQLAIFTNPFN
jgi:hypothetical protein